MDDLFEKYYTLVLRFLTFRPRSEKEVRDRLVKKHATEEIIDKIILELKNQNFLNDEKFVSWWVEQRTQFKPRSLRLIKIELRQKGIKSELIEEVLQKKETEVQNDVVSAKQIVESRIHRFKDLSEFELLQKLGPQLARRGFDYDTIRQAIDEVFKKGV